MRQEAADAVLQLHHQSRHESRVLAVEDFDRIAELITRLALRVTNLEEALKPFADGCAKADASAEESLRCGMGRMTDNATPGWGIRYGHLKAARALLTALTEGERG